MNHLLLNAAELLLLLFLIIALGQSALDKIFDWKGNLSWLTGHFSKSPFRNIVPLLLGTVLLTELTSSILCLVGFFVICSGGSETIALWGAIVAGLGFLMLLLGQRVAKDYDGARTIAIYFVPTIILVYLLQG